jgi:membrane peptidoglycan carboxypeptidase
MIPGMIGSVNYGSGRKAYDPLQTVAGKTGTCNGGSSWVGLFTSYAPLANPRLAVVVITRGTDAHHHLPAAVAGQIYRDLHQRFGTPTNLQIAPTPDDEEKEVGEEDDGTALIADQKPGEPADQKPGDTAAAPTDATASSTPAPAAPAPTHKLVPETGPNTVKRVLKPVNAPAQAPKVETQKSAEPTNASPRPPTQPETRPRRAQEIQP